MIVEAWLDEASERLEGYIEETPITYDENHDLYLKWENHQKTGSFKIRGALNKVLALEPVERNRGLVTASAGNHGQSVAFAGNQVGTKVDVFLSDHTVPTKVQAIQALGAEIHTVRGGFPDAEKAAKDFSRIHGSTYISPYNDRQVIAAQGTIGLEVLSQLPENSLCACLVPAGGGGLASGIGVALKRATDRIALIAVQSETSSYLQSLYQHGTQAGVVENASLADGLAGAVEEGSLTIPMVRKYVDGFELVSEDEIARAIATAWYRYNERIEGAAAVALAAAMSRKVAERPALVVISGGNIQPEVHAEICERWKKNLFEPEVV
jgi:threonine dehydratase